MHHHHHRHKRHDVAPRGPAPVPRPAPVPQTQLESSTTFNNEPPTLVKRDTSSTASVSCAPGDNSGKCEKPADQPSSTTLPIVLGAVVPVVLALIVFFFLHRRHVRRLKREDATDKTKSLDFGAGYTGPVGAKKAKKNRFDGPEMGELAFDEKPDRRARGLSMDLNSSPYLLPAGLHDSRDSLHSLSRTMHHGDDKYRPATTYSPTGFGGHADGSMRSFPSSQRARNQDDSSSYTGSSKDRFGTQDSLNQGLLGHAARMPSSTPPERNGSLQNNIPVIQVPQAAAQPRKPLPNSDLGGGLGLPTFDDNRDSYIDRDGGDMRRSHLHLAAFINPRDSHAPISKPSPLEHSIQRESSTEVVQEKDFPPAPAVPQKNQQRVSPPGSVKTLPSNPRPSPKEIPDMFPTNATRIYEQNLRERTESPAPSSIPSNTTRKPVGGKALGDVSVASNPGPQWNQPLDSTHALTSSTPPRQQSVDSPVTLPSNPRPLRNQSLDAPQVNITRFSNGSDYGSDYGDEENTFKVTPATPNRMSYLPDVNVGRHSLDAPLPEVEEALNQLEGNGLEPQPIDIRRLSMGFRPLPPEDPNDNPEQRANRIRSFYKEYFDESQPGPAPQAHGDYYEDYNQEYLAQYQTDAIPTFDQEHGNYIAAPPAPWAQPVTRRAMTPPPRAPPRFRPPPRNGSMGGSIGGPWMGGPPSYMRPPPRAYSSQSGRIGGPFGGPRGPGPRRPMPPPSDLSVLPTPHKLREDEHIFNPIDFAPPSRVKDNMQGRSDSPVGGLRPYSPTVRAHVPLASSFDDLSFMPSPHHLRKSGTFTGLDFAPVPRFKTSETASDAGSIRSNRTGVSQLHNIRSGAYRVSRIPQEVVPSKDMLAVNLKPTWEQRQHAA